MQSENLISMALRTARGIIKNGNGFRFVVTMNSGKEWDVIPLPGDNLYYPQTGIQYWQVEHGDNVLLLRHAEIAAIEVYEC